MPVQQVLSYGYAGENGANPVTRQVTVTGDGENNRTVTVPGGETVQVAIAWLDGALKSIFVASDRDAILETNGQNTEAQDAIPLTADHPFVWDALSGLTEQFAGAVTTVYLTNNETDDATVVIRSVIDSTL